MQNKWIVTIPLMLMIALSIFGFTYATWKDYVQIEGTVRMNSLTVCLDYIEPPICTEFYTDPATGVKMPGEYKNKQVGTPSCRYEELYTDPHTGKPGYKTLNITIVNAYPSYWVHTVFKLNNTGTLPAAIIGYEIIGEKRNATGAKVYDLLWYDPDGNGIGDLVEDVNDDGIVTFPPDIIVINVEITNRLPYQLDPCNTNKAEIDLHFKEEAQECHTYWFKVKIIAVQWNKAP